MLSTLGFVFFCMGRPQWEGVFQEWPYKTGEKWNDDNLFPWPECFQDQGGHRASDIYLIDNVDVPVKIANDNYF